MNLPNRRNEGAFVTSCNPPTPLEAGQWANEEQELILSSRYRPESPPKHGLLYDSDWGDAWSEQTGIASPTPRRFGKGCSKSGRDIGASTKDWSPTSSRESPEQSQEARARLRARGRRSIELSPGIYYDPKEGNPQPGSPLSSPMRLGSALDDSGRVARRKQAGVGSAKVPVAATEEDPAAAEPKSPSKRRSARASRKLSPVRFHESDISA